MDFVENVEAADVGVRAEAVDVWPARDDSRVVADSKHVSRAERDGVDISKAVPGHVNFVAWVLAVDGWRVAGEEGPVAADGGDGDVYLIEDWCCGVLDGSNRATNKVVSEYRKTYKVVIPV
jgi:hypothetical protein